MLESLLTDACERVGTPGAVLAIAGPDGDDAVAVGCAAVATGDAMTAEHQFPVMSITKSMTAAVVSDLCRGGQLALEATVRDVLTDVTDVPWTAHVTIDQLLACTGGVPAFHMPDTGEDDRAIDGLVGTLSDVRLVHEPGAMFSYSNTSFGILGAVVEAATGMVFDDVLQERLFGPLGMEASGSWYRAEPAKPIAQHHVLPDGTSFPIGWWKLRSCSAGGTGSVYGTATDIARYGRAHLTRWPELRSPQADFPGPHAGSWGRGWALYGWGGAVFGWDGFGPGAKTFLRVLPEHDTAIALFTNGSNGRDVYRTVVPELLRDRYGLTTSPESWPEGSAASGAGRIVGTYRNGRATVTISGDGDALQLDDFMGRSLPIRPVGGDRYLAPDTFEYPCIELTGDALQYFCSVWMRKT